MKSNIQEKYTAILIGCGIGDALGMSVEGLKKETIENKVGRVTEYMDSISPHTSYLKKGEYTDDTILTLAIAESIAKLGCLNLEDITKKQLEAYKACKLPDNDSGKQSFGGSTIKAFEKMMASGDLYNSAISPGLGNGPAMKMSPIGIYMHIRGKEENSLEIARQIGKSTHADERAVAAGVVQAYAIYNLLDSFIISKQSFLSEIIKKCKEHEKPISADAALPERGNLLSKLQWVYDNQDVENELAHKTLRNSAIAFESYPFTLFMFQKYWNNPVEGLIETINYGGDCDTTGAIYGSLAGAKNGMIFPDKWVNGLQDSEKIKALGEKLYNLRREK